MKINVSQKDIDKGVRGDSTKCPIALSIKRAFKNDNVKVYYQTSEDEDVRDLRIRVDNIYYSQKEIDKYEHLDNFIHWFDDALYTDCEPFKFNIDTSKTTI